MLTDEAIQKFADIVRRAERLGFDTRTSPWSEALAEAIRSEPRGEQGNEGRPSHPPVGDPSSVDLSKAWPDLAGSILRELKDTATELNEARAQNRQRDAVIDKLTREHELFRRICYKLEAERDALREERDSLKASSMEASEIYAQTVNDLALALGTRLDPCSSGCPGHLPAEAVQKLKRLRAENQAGAKEDPACGLAGMKFLGIPIVLDCAHPVSSVSLVGIPDRYVRFEVTLNEIKR